MYEYRTTERDGREAVPNDGARHRDTESLCESVFLSAFAGIGFLLWLSKSRSYLLLLGRSCPRAGAAGAALGE
jgi:hypothetical protein